MTQYQPQPYAYAAPTRPTSGLAVAGFICSLLWGFGVLSFLGAILSHAAMRTTSTGERGGHGLAVAGAILGWFGVVGALGFTLLGFAPLFFL